MPGQFFHGQTDQMLLDHAMKELAFLLAAFVFPHRFCFHRRPGQMLNVAQLETARAVKVIL